jgi:hypothetical protein
MKMYVRLISTGPGLQQVQDGSSGARLPVQVRLVLLEGELDASSCPLDIERREGKDPASWIVFYPEREPHALLHWFANVCGDGRGRLEFPATLSKRERASWHALAAQAQLHTQSVGVGEERYLTVCTAAPSDPGAHEHTQAGAAAGPRLTRQQQQRAQEIYSACQMEGGRHWERSHGEIEAMVASGQPLPPDIQELVDRRLVCPGGGGGCRSSRVVLHYQPPSLACSHTCVTKLTGPSEPAPPSGLPGSE